MEKKTKKFYEVSKEKEYLQKNPTNIKLQE